MIRWLTLVLLIGMAQAQTYYPGSLHQTNAQLTTISLPSPIPSIGNLTGAGGTYTPAAYGNTVIRCSDINTDPTNKSLHSWQVSDTGGGNDPVFNVNHTLLRLVATGTGTTRVVGFNGTACTTAVPSSTVPSGSAWDLVDPNVDWVLNGAQVYKRVFDYTNPQKAPTSAFVYDFATCPGLSAMGAIKWNASALPTNTPLGMVLVTAFSDLGGQDTGEYVATYSPKNGQCMVWNTLTGSICMGNASTFYPFTIHALSVGPNGIAEVGVGATCTGCPAHGPFFWQVNTTNVQLMTGKNLGGHNAMGYKTFVNLINAPAMAARVFPDMVTSTQISTAVGVHNPNPAETHTSWNNTNPADTAPIILSQVSQKQPQPLVITSPLEQEVYAVVPNAEFIRFAPTMTSGMSTSYNFWAINAIAPVSPDGACIAWTSDWMGTLGNADGVTSSCVLGAEKPNACRQDVFIVCPK